MPAIRDIVTPLSVGHVLAATSSSKQTPTMRELMRLNNQSFQNGMVIVEVRAMTDVQFAHSEDPTASGTSAVLTAGEPRHFVFDANKKLAFVTMAGAANGNVYIHPCEN